MTLFRNFFSCVRGHRSHSHCRVSSSSTVTTTTKVRFGEPLERAGRKESHLPRPIFRLVTFLAHEGIHTNDLFRRPGNINHMNVIIKLLAQGKPVQWTNYNLYTCANVAKKYLLNIPGGLFGRKGETMLLATLHWTEDERINQFLILLRHMVPATQELTILLFGILFRMVTHSVNVHHALTRISPPESAQNLSDSLNNPGSTQNNYTRSPTEQSIESQHLINRQTMLAEAVAKSVAGSLFHTCRDSPEKVERAAKVLENLILAFPSFDAEFIDFFDQAMNNMSHSTSSTISSHDMSISGSSKIVRKPSGLAASIEMWSESFGKSVSQRSSLRDPERSRFERPEPEVKRVSHVLHHNVPTNIPSITITSPFGDVNSPDSFSTECKEVSNNERDIITTKVADVTSFRHFQARIQSMKRRHQANLKKRSDWFLNNSPIPASPISRINTDYNSIVVVTCGGSSICLGQSEPIASGNRCLVMHSNNSALMSSYFASSGPDILQTTPGNSRPETPDYSMMSQAMEEESYCSSLSNSNAHIYDTNDTEIIPTLSSKMDQNISTDVEAPNSVPLIRRMLPSRSSTASRKTSIQQECSTQMYQSPDHEDEDEESIIDDTQSDCY